MITTERKPKIGNRAAHVVARLVLANGTVAGEGYGATEETAIYFAIQEAAQGNEQARTRAAFERRIRA